MELTMYGTRSVWYFLLTLSVIDGHTEVDGDIQRSRRQAGNSLNISRLSAYHPGRRHPGTGGSPVYIQNITYTGSGLDIPVDDTVSSLTVRLQTDTPPPPFAIPMLPGGLPVPFAPGSGYSRQTIGSTVLVFQMNISKPGEYGNWKFTKLDPAQWHVTTFARSPITFTHVFLGPGPGGQGQYPVNGNPIAGKHRKLQVTVPNHDKVQIVNTALIIRPTGRTLRLTLTNLAGRRNKAIFSTDVTIPDEDFYIAIEGVDNGGHVFRRQDPTLISPTTLRLFVPHITNGKLYKNEPLDIAFTVSNAAAVNQDILIRINDNRGFLVSPAFLTPTIVRHSNHTGTLSIRAGSIVGQTVAVTINIGKPYVPGKGFPPPEQTITRHFIVQERLKQTTDSISPTCMVRKVAGTCNMGSDLCKCSSYHWTMEVEAADMGFGLREMFPTGAGSNIVFHHDNFTAGVTLLTGSPVKASLRADCCHQNAAIHVVDMANNVGECTASITPNFKPPDAKVCNNKQPNITVPCKSTHTTGTCNFGPNPCDCQSQGWHIRAEFGTVGPSLYSAFSIGAGNNATIRRTGAIVEMDSDCCHQQITIVGTDIANNVGECNISLSNFTAPNITDCTTTLSTTTTTTTSTTTPTTTTTPSTTTTPTTTPTTTTTATTTAKTTTAVISTTTPTTTSKAIPTTTTTPTTRPRHVTTPSTVTTRVATPTTATTRVTTPKTTTTRVTTPKTTTMRVTTPTTTTTRITTPTTTTTHVTTPTKMKPHHHATQSTTKRTNPRPTNRRHVTTPSTVTTRVATPTTTTTRVTTPTTTTTRVTTPTSYTPTTTTTRVTTPTTTQIGWSTTSTSVSTGMSTQTTAHPTTNTASVTTVSPTATTAAGRSQSNDKEIARDVVVAVMVTAGILCLISVLVSIGIFRKANKKKNSVRPLTK